MGHLLREGLKTLCGVNQWSYAVFWKIACQNPKLLIWEECYYEPKGKPDEVHLLVNKMMMVGQFNIVEGLVGRVAFTGNHLWILSETYCGDSHPPEVVKEVCQQFSAGMQTVAVIPVLPYGVVQFGSCTTVMENLGFINDVTSLILELGHVSEAKQDAPPRIAVPVGSSTTGALFNYVDNSSQRSLSFAERIQTELLSNGATFHADGTRHQHNPLPVINGVAKAEVISLNSELWRNENTSLVSSSPPMNCSTVRDARLSVELSGLFNSGMSMDCVSDSKWMAGVNTDSKHPTSSQPKNEMFHKLEPSNSNSFDCFTSNSSLAYSSDNKLNHECKKEMGHDPIHAHNIPSSPFGEHLSMAELIPGSVQDARNQIPYYDESVQPELGDDLFDILGADFKNKLFSSCRRSFLSNESVPNMQNWESKNCVASSELYSESGTDRLLEAVVSKIQPASMDDNVSCKTTLTNMSSSSVPTNSLPYGRFDRLEGELFGVLKYLAKAGAMSSCSKEEPRSYLRGSSNYGSQISSLIEKDQKARPSHSKTQDEAGKANRKRLKPGENPRPRPKDRQMFQDRVKELREIVPNGAKCSLDVLLERTIKHMVFLQSVTKHADQLKQTVESKIISKDGGLLLKDNYEGGATWAYKVGSQSMVCPIIVEDLNQPRQMLVQMLCEERGLFLEIADIIRGLGLTILKGVMETRNGKIWAQFAVEANRDVTRMEIFISLVRLLDQSSTAISNQVQQFHQVPQCYTS